MKNNPENPLAMPLGNGNTGLLYKESASTDAPRILFQELTVTGRKVRRPLEISDTTSLPKVNTLDTGNLLFPWFDMKAGL